jgi:hypothetical protein
MQDEDMTLCNACTDLVSLKKWEAFPLRLLAGKPPGEWVGVSGFCQQIGVAANDLTPDLFVTWLPDPKAQDGYVVILFYDDESMWSMAAHYNRERLMSGTSSNQGLEPTGAVLPASSDSTPQLASSTDIAAAELPRS